jgi:hypothetical protein
MKVRVKEGQKGFICGSFRTDESPEFTLKPVKGIGIDGKPVEFTAAQQFSDVWMEKVESEKKSPGRPKASPDKED